MSSPDPPAAILGQTLAVHRLRDLVYASGWRSRTSLDFAFERLRTATHTLEAFAVLARYDDGSPISRGGLLTSFARDLALLQVLDRAFHLADTYLRTRTRENALELCHWPTLLGTAVARRTGSKRGAADLDAAEVLRLTSDLIRGGGFGSVSHLQRWREVQDAPPVLASAELERDQRLCELMNRCWTFGLRELKRVRPSSGSRGASPRSLPGHVAEELP